MSTDTFRATGHLLGYARVSTSDQVVQLQHDARTAAGCYRIFADTASGEFESHPELNKLLDQIRPGDTLVVWRLDRLGRSIRHLINHMNALQQRGIEFKSLQENIDTSYSGGTLVFNIFVSLAEFERELSHSY
ncbi:recombinase family protein [Glutamicibacter ardleyensis]|uniref:recombinase family protein n=1 Tax=Glutamicibacter ardleyensis TaxID=225894 RepID=UPI003FD3BD6B